MKAIKYYIIRNNVIWKIRNYENISCEHLFNCIYGFSENFFYYYKHNYYRILLFLEYNTFCRIIPLYWKYIMTLNLIQIVVLKIYFHFLSLKSSSSFCGEHK